MNFLTRNIKYFLLPLIVPLAYFLATYIVQGYFKAIGELIALPFAVACIYLLFSRPHTGLIVVMAYSVIINGLGRYISAPFSLIIDGLLAGALLATFYKAKNSDYKRVANVLVAAVAVWTFYTVMEIFNPQGLGIEPWFYAVRSISIYLLVIVVLTLLLFNKLKFLNIFIFIWFTGGIIGSVYGIKQDVIGLNAAENAWLAAGAADQHLLFGKLRIFSFFSDAGQFGAFMSFTSLVAIIMSLRTENVKRKVFYLFTGFICFYGLLISGTRGGLFVYIGAMVYLLLDKNIFSFVIGLVILGGIFCILRFTYIGAGSYDIQRLRSAVKPTEDASFQVRLENQRRLSKYLEDKPFGGGVGSSGYWGLRFKPESFLANTPTDSWYVRIWAETGWVGLWIYIGMAIVIMGYGFHIIWNLQNQMLRQKLMAIYAGCFGMFVASYGNQLIGQFPTTVFFSMSLAFIYLGKTLDRQAVQLEKEKKNDALL